jgi:hypothetical protein
MTEWRVWGGAADEPLGHGVDRFAGGGDQLVRGRASARVARLPPHRQGARNMRRGTCTPAPPYVRQARLWTGSCHDVGSRRVWLLCAARRVAAAARTDGRARGRLPRRCGCARTSGWTCGRATSSSTRRSCTRTWPRSSRRASPPRSELAMAGCGPARAAAAFRNEEPDGPTTAGTPEGGEGGRREARIQMWIGGGANAPLSPGF